MRKKNICRRALSLFVLLALLLGLGALSLPTLAAEERRVRVAWFLQTGYQEFTRSGLPTGLHVPYLEEIAERSGWICEFVPVSSFEKAYEMLRAGEVDIMGQLPKTAQYEQELLFPSICSGYASSTLFAKQDSGLAPYDFEGFAGLRVASIEGQQLDHLGSYAARSGFSFTTSTYPSGAAVKAAVLAGEVDAGLCTLYLPDADTRVIAQFSNRPFYFGVNPSKPEILEELEIALSDMQIVSPFGSNAASNPYLAEARDKIPLTRAEQSYVEMAPPLMVCCSEGWLPVAVWNKKTDEASGVSIDILTRIAELTGLRFVFRPHTGSEHVENAQIVTSVMNGSELQHDFVPTERFLNVPLVLVQPRGAAQKPVERTGMVRQIYAQFGNFATFGEETVSFDSYEQGLNALKRGEVDQLLMNSYASEYMLRRSEYRSMQVSVLYNETYNLYFGVKEEQDEILLSLMNKALAHISESEISAMINSTMAGAYEVNLSTLFSYMPPDMILFLFVVLCLLFGLLAVIAYRQRQHARRVQELLYTDELTGILSYKGLEAQAPAFFARAGNNRVFIVDMDVNHFGDYNTINGHQRGNELLRLIGQLLQTSFAGQSPLCARIQSDRFVLLTQAQHRQELLDAIEKLRQSLREIVGDGSFYLSFGVCDVEDCNQRLAVLCDRALIAKRTVKGDHQNYIALYDEALHKKQLDNVETLNRFEKSLADGEFIHYYQPKYDVQTGTLIGAEALTRWRTKEQGIIMPDHFIPLLEENGLICRMDLYMFERLCQKITQLLAQGIQPVPVSINCSRAHLFDPDFLGELAVLVQRYGVQPSLIEIEITESTFGDAANTLTQSIERLHAMGFAVAIDDFGSGYSSLNMLKDLDVDILKLDRGFLDSSSEGRKAESVVRNVIALAHDLEMYIVAEGVETAEQYQMLRECHCDSVQGFYFARPLPEEDFDKLLGRLGETGT